MKLKLKVSKTLKRDLKKLAEKQSLERGDYILNRFKQLLTDNESSWKGKIESYIIELGNRNNALVELKAQLEEQNISSDEKRIQLLNFYDRNKMFKTFNNRHKKLENIIVTLDDDDYYALQIIAEEHMKTIEDYAVEFLHHCK